MAVGPRLSPVSAGIVPRRIIFPRLLTPSHRSFDPTRSAIVCLLLILAWAAALCWHGLHVGELYRTEALRAIIGAEMLRNGDWIVPRLYGEPLLTKPPGMYAAIAAASWLRGEVVEWTARLPSALSATLLMVLLYWYFARNVGRLGGLIAAAIAPCSMLWLDKAAAAEIDMLQVFWVGAALLFFFRAVEAEEAGRNESSAMAAWFWWLLALLCVAGGVLTKWTAPAFFYAAAIPFLIWRRRPLLLFSWRHLTAACLGAGICLGWVVLVVNQVGWETFYTTVRNEALPRLSHSHHLGSVGEQIGETLLHPFKLLAVNLPWSGFALATLLPGFLQLWDERGRRLVQAMHCWTWPNVILWTILPDHATRHSFPLFTGMTGLAALAWLAFVQGRFSEMQAKWFGRYAALSLAVFAVGAISGSLIGFQLLPMTLWWLVVLLGGIGCWIAVAGLQTLRQGRNGRVLMAFLLSWVIVKLAFVHLYVPIRNHGRQPREKAAILAEHVPIGKKLYVFLLKDEGIMFYYGRPVVRLQRFEDLPRNEGPVWCILQRREFEEVTQHGGWEVATAISLNDEQGDPMVLVELHRRLVQDGIALAHLRLLI
ncbi:MAG: glycosyltransferase family 39 protein [Gemmatales bacterium]|nr:glycosyltransferase family 39 protein [Gemmatales bacterium]MDW8387587.1 glycosyltransferase family 39 protein [Gemmatales bacterium]